jgi:hypothetical protein
MNKRTAHSIGAVVLDKDPRAIKPNELSYANDNEILGTEAGRDMSSYPLPSSKLEFELNELVAQYQYVRAKFDPSADSYILTIKDTNGGAIGPDTITITLSSLPSPTAANFVDTLNTILNVYNYNAVLENEQGEWFILGIYQGSGTPIGYSITQSEVIGSAVTVLDIFTLQDFYNPIGASQAQLMPLQSIQVNDYLFVFSKTFDGQVQSIGVGVKDDNQVWTYTSLIETRNLDFPTDQVIEIQAEEVNNNQYAFYWVTNTGKPKTIYIPTDLSTPLRYNMFFFETPSPSGLFTLESISEQTNTQIRNFGIPSFHNQLQSGGSLEAGTWFYFIQAGINRNYSEWSGASEPIPVFTQTTKSSSAGSIIGGDRTPTITGKANQIRISGVDSKVYDTVRLAAMVNQGGAYSAVIVGEYDVVTSGNDFILTHTGLEQTIEQYDTGFLPAVQEVITNAKNVQIKKNRLNYANIEIQVEEDLDEVFENVVLSRTSTEMDSVGTVQFESENLFRAGLNEPYTNTLTGQNSIALDNDATNGNFDNGSYFNIGTGYFTVPTSSPIQVELSFSFIQKVDSDTSIAAKSVYILNVTTGERILEIGNLSGKYTTVNLQGGVSTVVFSVQNLVSNRQILTLQGGHQLVMAAEFVRYSGSGTSVSVIDASFSAIRIVSDFATKSLKVGEYQLPENVATKTGYMVNENYPFYARVHYNSGYISQWRYIGQHTFSGGSYPSGILEGNLTYIDGLGQTKVYAYGLTVSGLNVTNVKDRIKKIEIGRGICNPTILGTGIFIASDGATGGAGGSFSSGLYTGNTSGTGYPFSDTSDNRLFGMMLCPDWATGNIKPQYQEGDMLIVYGAPSTFAAQTIAGGTNKWGSYREFLGGFQPNSGASYMIEIADAAYCEWNTDSRVLRNDFNNLFYSAALINDGSETTLAVESMAMALRSKINPLPSMISIADYGCYYVQYLRPNASQYSPVDTTVVSCNAFIDVSSSSDNILPDFDVYGGDTYTQKTYMKVMYNAKNPDEAKAGNLTSFIGFYSQNKINQQMRFSDKSFNNQPFPFGNSLDNYLFGNYEAGEQFQIDLGYSWESKLNDSLPYNPKLPRQSKFKSRIIYSQQKPLNSLQDTYRIILPNDFKDLDAKNGEINGLYDINDVMVGLQPFKVSVLPYQSDVGLSAQDGSLFVGSGGVYAQRENPISTYGAKIKSGTLVAENEAGNTVLYWYSENGRGLFRYGSDGVKNLSEENSWRTWFFNQTNLIKSEFDIVMGFDRTRSAIFTTARAFNEDIAAWNSGTAYTEGQVVKYAPVNNQYKNFERLPDFYVAKANNTNQNPFTSPTSWEYIQPTDKRYYNYWTAVFNEKYNFFQGFFSLIPSRYFYYNGEVFLPRGIAPFDNMFNLFGGSGHLQWLNVDGQFKQGNFILEWVSNSGGFIPCRYSAMGLIVGTDHTNNPSLLVTTDTQTSLSVGGSEFTYLNGQIAQGILPDENDDPITSEYAKIRLSNTAFYRVFGAVVTFYQRARTLFK